MIWKYRTQTVILSYWEFYEVLSFYWQHGILSLLWYVSFRFFGMCHFIVISFGKITWSMSSFVNLWIWHLAKVIMDFLSIHQPNAMMTWKCRIQSFCQFENDIRLLVSIDNTAFCHFERHFANSIPDFYFPIIRARNKRTKVS